MAVAARVLGTSVPITEVVSARLWKERYAYGLLLGQVRREWATVQRGGDPRRELTRTVDSLPDDTIRWHLRCALSELEVKLGVPMAVQICKSQPIDEGLVQGRDYDRAVPRMAYTRGMDESWWRLDLPPGLISVERVRAYFYGTKLFEFADTNIDQVRIEWPRQGGVHILPQNLAGVLVGAYGDIGLWHRLYARYQQIPDFWSVDYTTGPTDQNGQPGHIEAVLADWVYCIAARKLLPLAGMGISKGVASSSVSMDGVSRTTTLQTNATAGLYGPVEAAYKEAADRIDWKALRTYKRGIRVKMYG